MAKAAHAPEVNISALIDRLSRQLATLEFSPVDTAKILDPKKDNLQKRVLAVAAILSRLKDICRDSLERKKERINGVYSWQGRRSIRSLMVTGVLDDLYVAQKYLEGSP